MRNLDVIMKKFRILLFLFCLGIGFTEVNAQFSDFNPVSPRTSSNYRRAPIQQTYGYVRTSNGWVRVNIRIQATPYGVNIVGYKNKDIGMDQYFSSYGDGWNKCNASAEEVSAFEDGRTAANNFDYKAYVSGLGTVYF